MQYKHDTLELHRVNGAICIPVPVLNNFHNAGGTKALERPGLVVLPTGLSKVKCISKDVHDWIGQRK